MADELVDRQVVGNVGPGKAPKPEIDRLDLAPFSAVGEVLFFPWWGDVEVVEDGSLGGGEAVESDAVVGVGESESLERGEGVSAGG